MNALHLLSTACDVLVVLAVVTAFLAFVLWLIGHAEDEPVAEPDDEIRYVQAILRVPQLLIPEGHRTQPCELIAVDHLVTHQVESIAEQLHDGVMEAVLAQVAAHEAKCLDADLEQMGGAR